MNDTTTKFKQTIQQYIKVFNICNEVDKNSKELIDKIEYEIENEFQLEEVKRELIAIAIDIKHVNVINEELGVSLFYDTLFTLSKQYNVKDICV